MSQHAFSSSSLDLGPCPHVLGTGCAWRHRTCSVLVQAKARNRSSCRCPLLAPMAWQGRADSPSRSLRRAWAGAQRTHSAFVQAKVRNRSGCRCPLLASWLGRGALTRLRALFAGLGLVLNALSLLLFRRRHETGELFGDHVAAAIPFFHRLVFASFYGRRAYKQFWVAVYGGFAQSLFGGYVGIMGVFSLSSVWGCGRAGHAISLRWDSAGPGAILPIVPLSHVPSPIW